MAKYSKALFEKTWIKFCLVGMFILTIIFLIMIFFKSFLFLIPLCSQQITIFTLIYLAILALFALFISFFIGYGNIIRRHIRVFEAYKKSVRIRDSVSFLLPLLASSVIVVYVLNRITSFNIFARQGIIFVFVLSFITLYGFMLTLTRIDDIHGRITTYKEYLSHAIDLLETAIKNVKSNGEALESNVRILCYTPLHGNISLRGSKKYEQYKKKLLESLFTMKLKVEIVALESSEYIELKKSGLPVTMNANYDLKYKPISIIDEIIKLNKIDCELWKFYKGFTDRNFERINISQTEISPSLKNIFDAYIESTQLLSSIHKNISISKKKYSELPTFHFILIHNKALVGIPLRLPKPVHIPYYTGLITDSEKVEMIGFITSEAHILDELNSTFEYYKGSKIDKEIWFGQNKQLYGRLNSSKEDVESTLPVLFIHGLNGDHNEGFNAFKTISDELTIGSQFFNKDFTTFRYDSYGIGNSIYNESLLNRQEAIENVTYETFINSANYAIKHVCNELTSPDLSNDLIIIAHGLGALFAILTLATNQILPIYKRVFLIFWAPIFFPNTTWKAINKLDDQNDVKANWIGPKYKARIFSDKLFQDSLKFENKIDSSLKKLKEKITQIFIIKSDDDPLCTDEHITVFKDKVNEVLGPDRCPKTISVGRFDHFDRDYTELLTFETAEILMNFHSTNWISTYKGHKPTETRKK